MKSKYLIFGGIVIILSMLVCINVFVIQKQTAANTKNEEIVIINVTTLIYNEENTSSTIKNEEKEEMTTKIEALLNSTLDNKASFLVEYALANNVDPYLASAIIQLETGCSGNCSYIARTCNNFGGMKGGKNRCNGGSYALFYSVEDGLMAFINNLSKNYIAKGLTTPEQINTKYATSDTWAFRINNYMNKLKNG